VVNRRRKLLDINPEGGLSKEIKDILDELHTIRKICIDQLIVIRDFENHLKEINSSRVTSPDTIRRAAASTKGVERRITDVDELIKAAERTEKGVSE